MFPFASAINNFKTILKQKQNERNLKCACNKKEKEKEEVFENEEE